MPKGKGGNAEGFRRSASREDDEDAILTDAQGEEREDALEDERIAPNLDNDDDEREEIDRVSARKGAPPVYDDPRDAIAKSYNARKAGGGEDKSPEAAPGEVVIVDRAGNPISEDTAEEDDDGDADDGEVVILGRDGKPVNPQNTANSDDGPRQREEGNGEAAAAAGASEDDEIPLDRIVTMTVDGKKVKLPYGDMLAIAQIKAASEARLAEANGILDRARSGGEQDSNRDRPTMRDDSRGRDDTQGQPSGGASGKKTNLDRTRLLDVVNAIQMGSPEEGADALGELIGASQTNADPVDVRSAVSESLAEERALQEIDAGVARVSTEYKDVLGNGRLEKLAYIEAHELAVKALKAIGVPDEDLQQDAPTVLVGYARLRQDPRFASKLQPIGEMFATAAGTIRKEFRTTPPPRDENRDTRGSEQRGQGGGPRISRSADQPPRIIRSTVREERKSAISSQPRSASAPRNINGAPPAARKSNSEIVAEMRANRAAR